VRLKKKSPGVGPGNKYYLKPFKGGSVHPDLEISVLNQRIRAWPSCCIKATLILDFSVSNANT
jgi:hypothetical protein